MNILIIGAGKLGAKLAFALDSTNMEITVVDSNRDVINSISDQIDVLTIHANGIEASALQELDVKRYDMAIVVTGSDKNNIICSSMLKKLGCPNVIARIRDPEFVKQQAFIQGIMHIDHVVNPELATAKEICSFLEKELPYYTVDFANGKIMIANIPAEDFPDWWDVALKDIKISENNLLITAIKRDGEIIIPNGKTVIQKQDNFFMIGNTQEMYEFIRSKETNYENKAIKEVMIIGGGRIGYYLASELSKQELKIKVVERDEQRCKYLTDNMPENVQIICGNGSDMELMARENMTGMDAFIGVTGHDEENLFMTLLAKHMGVNRVVAKVSRSNYVDIIEQLGADAAFSTVDISASDILKYVKGRALLSTAMLLGGQAQIMEFLINKNMKIINRPISHLSIPSGIIFAALLKEDDVIIPQGSTVIEPGDKLIAFCMSSQVPKLEKFIYSKKDKLLHRE
jgi:trk system potassium uptake protein TrkA